MVANDRVPEPADGSMRDVLVGWLDFHRSALEAKCAGLDADRLVDTVGTAVAVVVARPRPPHHRDGAGYGSWALGPRDALQWVWGEYTDDGPDWDFDADASMFGGRSTPGGRSGR